jgi:hypothetical protein
MPYPDGSLHSRIGNETSQRSQGAQDWNNEGEEDDDDEHGQDAIDQRSEHRTDVENRCKVRSTECLLKQQSYVSASSATKFRSSR